MHRLAPTRHQRPSNPRPGNNAIIKPITEYEDLSYSATIYNRIIDTMYTNCMAEKGINYVPGTPLVPIGSREYGFWNPDYSEKYGYGIFENFSEGTPLTDKEQEELKSCQETPEIKDHSQSLKEIGKKTDLASNILTEARGYALKDPVWKEARKNWWDCLTREGLTPRTGDEAWGSKQSQDIDTSTQAGKEEKVRIVLLEAKCSQETGMAQTLANLEASYQSPLIKENQSALNETKAAIQEFRAEMERKYQSMQ